MGSLSFDRVAHEYDATRGGDERGAAYAEVLVPLLPDDVALLEVGIGTGVVARALTGTGRTVVGVDLSPNMLARAVQRVGPRVAVGDAQQLPVRDASVPAAYSVWVLHLVGDVGAVLAEVRRAVRPGGRYVVVSAAVDPPPDDDELGCIVWQMQDALREGEPKPDHPQRLVPLAEAAGWSVSVLELVSLREWTQSPAEVARTIESRTWSQLWDVDGERWARIVQPAIDALLRLPDVQQPRTRRSAEWVLALDR